MFITQFTGPFVCNEFSLASVDSGGSPMNPEFLQHYRLGRCKFAQVVPRPQFLGIP